jgi:hypothetical protein
MADGIGKSWKWLVAMGAVFVPATLLAAVDIPNTFSAGTPIRAAEMNANFNALETFVNDLETTVNGKADSPATGAFIAGAQGRIAYAWVDPGCAFSTVPNCAVDSTYQFNSGGSGITSTRNSVGNYSIRFTGLTLPGGHVQVTPYGAARFCSVNFWTAPNVDVSCVDANGAAADSAFNILFVF